VLLAKSLGSASPGAKLSTNAVAVYGRTVRALRSFTHASLSKEPAWRHKKPTLNTGYQPSTYQ